MYLGNFSKMTLSLNVIFDAFNRDEIGLQENNFLKYLKIPQNLILCTEPSQELKLVD